jgi:hypothetical protein
MPRPMKTRSAPRPLAAGETCGCGRATAPDLRERLADGRILLHRRRSCSVELTPRDGAILIRLAPQEREALTIAAEKAGQGLGPWLRSLGLRETHRGS